MTDWHPEQPKQDEKGKKTNVFYAKQRIQINKLKLARKDSPHQALCLTDTTLLKLRA